MKIDLARCPLVVIGSWNHAIFTPPWVERNLLTGPETVTVELGFGPQGLVSQFHSGPIQFTSAPGRVSFVPSTVDDSTFKAMEASARQLLSRLPETPISAIGINFGFDVPERAESVEGLLTTNDQGLLGDNGIEVEATLLKRRMQFEQRVFNLSVSREAGEAVRIDFNFHYNVADPEEAADKVDGAVLVARDVAIQALEDLYGLRLED